MKVAGSKILCKFKECNKVLGCPSGSINTHYESHKTRKRPYETTSSITTFFPQKTTKAEQADITEMLADFCIESGSSFRFATSPAMKNLFIKANNFGIRRNKMLDENFEMPHRSTIGKKCYEVSEQILEDKKHLLIDALKNVCGIAVDYGFRKNDFLGAILHPQEEVVTRWLSKLQMINSVLKIQPKLNELRNTELRSKMSMDFLENLRIIGRNLDELQNIVTLLNLLEEIVCFFQTEKSITLHLVWPKIFELKKKLSLLANDQSFIGSEISLAILRFAQKCLQRKIDDGLITDLHKAATFLAPKRRLLTGVSDSERHNIYEYVRSEMRKRKRACFIANRTE